MNRSVQIFVVCTHTSLIFVHLKIQRGYFRSGYRYFRTSPKKLAKLPSPSIYNHCKTTARIITPNKNWTRSSTTADNWDEHQLRKNRHEIDNFFQIFRRWTSFELVRSGTTRSTTQNDWLNENNEDIDATPASTPRRLHHWLPDSFQKYLHYPPEMRNFKHATQTLVFIFREKVQRDRRDQRYIHIHTYTHTY